MQILILGAGQVGGILAESLAKERFDVTLVDKDASRLKEVGERLDIKTIHGEASHPDVLRRAGAEEVDIFAFVYLPDNVVEFVANYKIGNKYQKKVEYLEDIDPLKTLRRSITIVDEIKNAVTKTTI